MTVQTAATAAGGLGIIFVGPIPAMYQMGLMSNKAEEGKHLIPVLVLGVS